MDARPELECLAADVFEADAFEQNHAFQSDQQFCGFRLARFRCCAVELRSTPGQEAFCDLIADLQVKCIVAGRQAGDCVKMQ